MNTKDENLLVKAIKKVVGLPTEDSSCSCGTPSSKSGDCCSAEATQSSVTECGCGSNTIQQHEEQPTQP